MGTDFSVTRSENEYNRRRTIPTTLNRRTTPVPKTRFATVDDYLAALSPEKRATLHKLRKAIRSASPQAEECISYGLAAFRLNGKPLAGFGASANHLSFFPMSGSITTALADDLVGYDTSKGAIRFPVNKPLPVALVRKVIKARTAEIAAQGGTAKSK